MNIEHNTDFIVRMMDRSNCGPMMQLFIMQAVAFYTKETTERFLNDPNYMDSHSGFIHPQAWHECAKELHKELVKRGLIQ